MPSLRIEAPGKKPKVYHLFKKITTFGKSEENDVVLEDPLVGETHAHLHFDGRGYVIQAIDRQHELFVNGRKKKKMRVEHGDRLRIGAYELLFSLLDESAPIDEEAASTVVEVSGYQRLHEFSERLLRDYKLENLLETLMDTVIEITSADKGFLILTIGEETEVKVARNLKRENILNAVDQFSDSIVEQVIRERKPLIISDALHDAQFANSKSVINLRLTSVMCVPLMERGNLLGIIYVGNDNVVNLFEESTLNVLKVFAAQASLLIRNALLINELQLDKRSLTERIERYTFGDIIGSCEAMQEIYKRIRKIAGTDVSVLISGETGTGKELIAREVHRRSNRASGPFVTINCGAIPENLLESELFGHVKGSFTGAVATKEGRFQCANRGTLFLDEIGEMPLQLQVKILRAIQERTVIKVGGNKPESVDIRIIAATNRILEEEIKGGRFREDLYYRLNVVNIHLPPLRERGEDIVLIAKYLLSKYTQEYDSPIRGFSPNAIIAMKKCDWQGNIRQLENHIKKAVILGDKALLGPEDLGLTADMMDEILPLAAAKEEFQRRYINEVLARNSGNRTKTARDLGVDPRTIFRHLEKEEESGNRIPEEKGEF
ncbi:MAG: sigma 54-interacting transcriptional regulator [Polyangia bacterium]|jgi:transcriptional regulator with GAF, ATPase, and Fis domain|nr:sigma 54-interacting transcriptional regulator [Polyangia bacterium]